MEITLDYKKIELFLKKDFYFPNYLQKDEKKILYLTMLIRVSTKD